MSTITDVNDRYISKAPRVLLIFYSLIILYLQLSGFSQYDQFVQHISPVFHFLGGICYTLNIPLYIDVESRWFYCYEGKVIFFCLQMLHLVPAIVFILFFKKIKDKVQTIVRRHIEESSVDDSMFTQSFDYFLTHSILAVSILHVFLLNAFYLLNSTNSSSFHSSSRYHHTQWYESLFSMLRGSIPGNFARMETFQQLSIILFIIFSVLFIVVSFILAKNRIFQKYGEFLVVTSIGLIVALQVAVNYLFVGIDDPLLIATFIVVALFFFNILVGSLFSFFIYFYNRAPKKNRTAKALAVFTGPFAYIYVHKWLKFILLTVFYFALGVLSYGIISAILWLIILLTIKKDVMDYNAKLDLSIKQYLVSNPEINPFQKNENSPVKKPVLKSFLISIFVWFPYGLHALRKAAKIDFCNTMGFTGVSDLLGQRIEKTIRESVYFCFFSVLIVLLSSQIVIITANYSRIPDAAYFIPVIIGVALYIATWIRLLSTSIEQGNVEPY